MILTSTHNMFLWRYKQNYPKIILKYPPYLFHCQSTPGCGIPSGRHVMYLNFLILYVLMNFHYVSGLVTKPTKWHVCPAKTQISLDINPVWSESSLCTQWVAKDLSFLHMDSEDSDQTGRMPRQIWVFAGRIAILLVLLCRGQGYRKPIFCRSRPIFSL